MTSGCHGKPKASYSIFCPARMPAGQDLPVRLRDSVPNLSRFGCQTEVNLACLRPTNIPGPLVAETVLNVQAIRSGSDCLSLQRLRLPVVRHLGAHNAGQIRLERNKIDHIERVPVRIDYQLYFKGPASFRNSSR